MADQLPSDHPYAGIDFTIDENGSLRTAREFDYETDDHNYSVRISATDDHNATTYNDFTITLTNVVEDLDGDGTERPIASFQAIKHKLADVYVGNQLALSNAYFGAWALASDSDELPLAAAVARVSATEAYEHAAAENVQIHGGMGFTWEADCHLFLRRSRSLALLIGD